MCGYHLSKKQELLGNIRLSISFSLDDPSSGFFVESHKDMTRYLIIVGRIVVCMVFCGIFL